MSYKDLPVWERHEIIKEDILFLAQKRMNQVDLEELDNLLDEYKYALLDYEDYINDEDA